MIIKVCVNCKESTNGKYKEIKFKSFNENNCTLLKLLKKKK